jgi:hypothetical protein
MQISAGAWIVHLDASFEYSRHTIADPLGASIM